MRHAPGFVAVTVLTLALSIGATTAAMSVAAAVLHDPLPVKNDARLLLVTKTLPGSTTLVPFSYAELAGWRDASRTLESVAGVQYDGAWPSPADLGDRASTVTVALGASRAHLRTLVLSRIAGPAFAGLLIGTVAAIAATRLLQPLLFEVSAIDARAFAAAWATLALAALMASVIPLRRARHVDPAKLLSPEAD